MKNKKVFRKKKKVKSLVHKRKRHAQKLLVIANKMGIFFFTNKEISLRTGRSETNLYVDNAEAHIINVEFYAELARYKKEITQYIKIIGNNLLQEEVEEELNGD